MEVRFGCVNDVWLLLFFRSTIRSFFDHRFSFIMGFAMFHMHGAIRLVLTIEVMKGNKDENRIHNKNVNSKRLL